MHHKYFAFTIITFLWTLPIIAQYVPQSHRKSNIKLHTIKIKKGQQITAARPVLFCDTLIMADESTLRVPHTFKSFTLYAQYCKIGKHCLIFSRGKNGKEDVWENNMGEAGTNAPHLNLYLNIYALGNLVVDATGGNGAPAPGRFKIPGVYGSGGNVNLSYYSPIVINVNKVNLKNLRKRRRRKASRNPEIMIGNTVGKMSRRMPRAYYYISDNDPRTLVRKNDLGIHEESLLLREKNKHKNGQLKFTRKDSIILPEEVKIK
ncbi:hypothetical protein BKI52_00720 [marine bacterium AO1-C]|nr:hypothetical protein BKI52_00720 [marine bacterium AO1-C]